MRASSASRAAASCASSAATCSFRRRPSGVVRLALASGASLRLPASWCSLRARFARSARSGARRAPARGAHGAVDVDARRRAAGSSRRSRRDARRATRGSSIAPQGSIRGVRRASRAISRRVVPSSAPPRSYLPLEVACRFPGSRDTAWSILLPLALAACDALSPERVGGVGVEGGGRPQRVVHAPRLVRARDREPAGADLPTARSRGSSCAVAPAPRSCSSPTW